MERSVLGVSGPVMRIASGAGPLEFFAVERHGAFGSAESIARSMV